MIACMQQGQESGFYMHNAREKEKDALVSKPFIVLTSPGLLYT